MVRGEDGAVTSLGCTGIIVTRNMRELRGEWVGECINNSGLIEWYILDLIKRSLGRWERGGPRTTTTIELRGVDECMYKQ